MSGEQRVTVDLGHGAKMVVVAETFGGTLVADREIAGTWHEINSAVERVSRDMLQAVRKARPSKAVVELGFGVTVEAGHLVALFGNGKGEATIKVTLEWTRQDTTREVDGASSESLGAAAGTHGQVA